LIVLDTHTLIWWVNGDSQLSPNARAAVDHEQHFIGRSPLLNDASCWHPFRYPILLKIKCCRSVLGDQFN
jgi:hypothetical protein